MYNACHGADGEYDGVTDPEIGAKFNKGTEVNPNEWVSDIYDADGLLKPGKENWCLGCHGDGFAEIHGVQAPNIAGKTIVEGTWKNPETYVDTGFTSAGALLDGDSSTGNEGGETQDLIFDLGSVQDITHIRIFNSEPAKSLFEVYGSTDQANWKRIIYGQRIAGAKPYWNITGQGWFDTRLDDFSPIRYVKLVRVSRSALPEKGLREFEYKADLSYGYMVSGHKVACDYCHDTKSIHLDSIARTYSAAENNYTDGYRLADVVVENESVPALEVPRVACNSGDHPKTDNDFALCFTCHDKQNLLGDAYGQGDYQKIPLQTYFRNDASPDENGNTVNAHLVHLQNRGRCGNSATWDSDWDGTPDSPISCMACHNVHGSPSPAMVRHGELASTPGTSDKVPMLNFKYYDAEGHPDAELMDTMQSTGGVLIFYGGGPGSVAKNKTCNMCHGDKKPYTRTP